MMHDHNAKNHPWAQWLFYAAHIFHLTPAQFWQLSLIEWRWLLCALTPQAPASMPRAALDHLRQTYPDKSHG